MSRDENWEKAVAFHGHSCPGLAIGFRACEAAMEKMGIGSSRDEEIVCITENDACGVDAIQALLSCTLGKGNLLYHGAGKQAFSFLNRKNGDKLRVYLKMQKKEGISRQEWQKQLLDAPLEDVFVFSKPQYNMPEKARKFPSECCEICGELAAEHKIRLQEGKKVCLDCWVTYDRGW